MMERITVRFGANMTTLGGKVIAVQFGDALAENERLQDDLNRIEAQRERDNAGIKNMLLLQSIKIDAAIRKAREFAEGRTVKIISDYNGQPYGHSKPSMKGQTFKVKNVEITSGGGGGVYFWDGNCDHVYISMDEVEFIEATP